MNITELLQKFNRKFLKGELEPQIGEKWTVFVEK